MRTQTGDQPFAPVAMLDVEMTEPLPSVKPGTTEVWATIRAFTEPLAQLRLPVPEKGLAPSDLEAAIKTAGISLPVSSDYLASRQTVLTQAPFISAVVCTRAAAWPDLERCLESLLEQDYPNFEVLVVDNAPQGGGCAELVERLAKSKDVTIRRIVEPKPGLSRARNRAIEAATADIIAWIDDDEVADRHWLAEVARAYYEHPEAGAVAGLVLPAEIETNAQAYFERWGGHSKGRGFLGEVFSPERFEARDDESPLYPRPCFGTGANMSFRRSAIDGIGRFNERLGAGTPARAGEDTLALTEFLYGGGTLVYQPSALTFHYHRRDMAGIEKQFFGLGSGLAAFYVALLVRHPRAAPELLRMVRKAPSSASDWQGLPTALKLRRRAGLLAGPALYALSRWL